LKTGLDKESRHGGGFYFRVFVGFGGEERYNYPLTVQRIFRQDNKIIKMNKK
jgi:hypothetical protein